MKKLFFAVMLFVSMSMSASAQEPYIGEIKAVAFNFAPVGWLPCDGRLLPISQYTALFALLGTQYGGDGKTTFALPDLRGRVAVGAGIGPGLSQRTMGEIMGQETHTLITSEMPTHMHSSMICSGSATTDTPSSTNYLTKNSEGVKQYAASSPSNGPVVTPAGSNMPHNNMQPSTVINYIIAVYGIFPPRD